MNNADLPHTETPKPIVFAALPADIRHRPIYERVVRPVLEGCGLICITADRGSPAATVVARLLEQIEQATFVICDLTLEDHNAFYEMGMAHALRKPTLLISQDAANLPFDFRQWRVIQYEDNNLGLLDLRDRLQVAVMQMLSHAQAPGLLDVTTNQLQASEQDLAYHRQALYSDAVEVRRYAIRYLGEYGDALSFPVIQQIALAGDNSDITRDAFTALHRIDPAQTRPLLLGPALRYQPDVYVRERAVLLLGTYPPDEELVSQMINQLTDTSWGVRRAVCQVLGQWGTTTAIGALQGKLSDTVLQVRMAAAVAYEHLRAIDSAAPARAEVNLTQEQLVTLRKMIDKHFIEEELRDLCFELRVDYEGDLEGKGKRAKARELVVYCDRQGHLAELMEQCRKLRPDAPWDDVTRAK